MSKQFVLADSTFHFGPLLVGKTREPRTRYPENMEKLSFVNEGPLKAELSFAFRKDATAVTFILEPAHMTLEPKEKKVPF